MSKIVIVNGFTLLTHANGILSDTLQHGLFMLQNIQAIAQKHDAPVVCIGAVNMGRNMPARAVTVLHRIFSEIKRPWLFLAEGNDHIALEIASIYGQASQLSKNETYSIDEVVLEGFSNEVIVRHGDTKFRIQSSTENEIIQGPEGVICVSIAPYWMHSQSSPLPHCAILDTTATRVEMVPIISKKQLPVFGNNEPEKTNLSHLDGLIVALGAKGVNRILLSDSQALQQHLTTHFTELKAVKPMSNFAETSVHELMAEAIAEQFAQHP